MQSLASTSTCEHRHRTWQALHPPSCHNTPPRPYPLLTPTNSVPYLAQPQPTCRMSQLRRFDWQTFFFHKTVSPFLLFSPIFLSV